jgi:hypothetical protein
LDLPIDYLAWQLPEIFNFQNPWIVKLAQKQCFSPEILVEIKLFKFGIFNIKKVEDVLLHVLKNGMSFGPESIVEVVNMQVIDALHPAINFLLFGLLGNSRTLMLLGDCGPREGMRMG